MTKRVYVIASFNTDGDTQPLWLKLSLDKDAPCYKIENYICTKKTDKYREYAQYRCTVSCKNQRHEIGLNYYALLGFWTMTVSNSSSMAIDIS